MRIGTISPYCQTMRTMRSQFHTEDCHGILDLPAGIPFNPYDVPGPVLWEMARQGMPVKTDIDGRVRDGRWVTTGYSAEDYDGMWIELIGQHSNEEECSILWVEVPTETWGWMALQHFHIWEMFDAQGRCRVDTVYGAEVEILRRSWNGQNGCGREAKIKRVECRPLTELERTLLNNEIMEMFPEVFQGLSLDKMLATKNPA